MQYLVDTNIFLEILLNQDRKEDCKMFLEKNIKKLFISDFSLHSIGVILFRNKKEKIFNMFVTDILQNIEILSLTKFKYSYLDDIKKKYQLDFDDSYQLAIAQDHNLEIATMDFDFKKVSDNQKVLFL
jgi:predicted nucleic acid-binding protein